MESRKLEYRCEASASTGWTNSSAPRPVGDDENLPDYLVGHYGWAYLWPLTVWFFDHQPIINAILFGNYRRIMNATRRLMDTSRAGKTLQIAAVYGELTPTLAAEVEKLHVAEIAPVQLRAVERKLKAAGLKATLRQMNAERLDYESQSFDTALIFLLLHELTPEARHNSLREAIRVLRPGGRLIIAEYGEARCGHFFHRFAPIRWIFTRAEPFLSDFWREDLVEKVHGVAAEEGRGIELQEQVDIFGGFYRVMQYCVD